MSDAGSAMCNGSTSVRSCPCWHRGCALPERQQYQIPWGGGLDRASGIGVVQPASWADLRNVLLYDGKAEVRKGMTAISALLDGGMVQQTDVLAIVPFRQRESVLCVAWDEVTRVVSIFEAASNGKNPVFVANWFTAEAAIGTPRIRMAESYGRMFLAHDYQYVKPGVSYLRAPTVIYDGTTVANLTADLDRSASAETVRFRWVQSWLNYMLGGGYGTGSDEDRGEIIRVSKPALPTGWVPEHYFAVGKRGDPVVIGLPGPRSFVAFKDAQTYALLGTNARDFGQIGPIDPLHGCPGAGLAIHWGGMVWFWSYDGPRITEGVGRSTALDVPLDLHAPEPADLAAAGDLATGFVVYDPRGQKLDWCFPTDAADVTRVYSTHVRTWPDRIRWSYDERQRRVRCGAVLYPVAQVGPPGHPDVVIVDQITATGFRLLWQNVAALGDEVTEVWLQNSTDAGPWIKIAEFAYEASSMQKTFNNVLEAEDDYNLALRHRRGSLYNSGAEMTSNPAGWPAASRTSFTAAAVGSQPAAFELHDSLSEFYGGKEYIRHEVQWTAPADTARGWEIYENTVDNFGTAVLAASGKNHVVSDPQSGLVTRTCDTGGCVTTNLLVKLVDPPPVQDYYYYIVFVDGGTWVPGVGFGGSGARSPETALIENPINYGAIP